MKEATGELNMTVVTVVAIAAIGALLYAFVWPALERQIVNNTCTTFGVGYEADSTGTGKDKVWECCPAGKSAGDPTCINAKE